MESSGFHGIRADEDALGKILGLYIFYNEYREIGNETSTV